MKIDNEVRVWCIGKENETQHSVLKTAKGNN
jgi:hypothetical protein